MGVFGSPGDNAAMWQYAGAQVMHKSMNMEAPEVFQVPERHWSKFLQLETKLVWRST